MANKTRKKIILVAGARPNFMKIAPIMKEMKKYPDRFQPIFVHTGQHYDNNMSEIFLHDLGLPEPDIYLGVGSASHAVQTAKVMVEFEKVLEKEKPDLVIVVGDVNSTLACALVASKLGIKIAHVEAGLRSFDRTMPEEINRVLTDQISDILFTTCEDARDNLIREGIEEDKIYFVGNAMIESLIMASKKVQESKILQKMGLKRREYSLVTLHRPSNVDHRETFKEIFKALHKIAEEIPLVFPAHPRTKKRMKEFNFPDYKYNNGLFMTDPVSYFDFLSLEMNAKFMLTDSGGVQEETAFLKYRVLLSGKIQKGQLLLLKVPML